MTSSECRDYLGHLQHFGIKLGLENIAALCAALGDPQNRFPSIHVAGTNGKGSVSAMLAGIMKEHGFRTGLYTSPHLARVEERIRVDGASIPPPRFRSLLERLKATIDGLMADGRLDYHPTYFEVMTALAFLRFAERKVDIAVLEVGMGGRFDATNVVRPLVSVITTIALDHETHLGSSLKSIAFEKAGIIKPGVPVVCGVRCGDALREIRRVARERGAHVVEAFGPGRTLDVRPVRGGFRFVYPGERGLYAFSPALAGRHQGANAAVAIAAAEVVSRIWKPLDKAKIIKAIRETRWEGRLETVRPRPLVLLDGAHNVEGAEALAAHIRETIRRPVVLVFAAMRDKDIRSMTRLLFPLCAAVVLTRVPYKRSATPEELAAAAPAFPGRVLLEPDTRRAVHLALAESRGRIPVVIAGSLFLIGEVKRLKLFG
ncbi:MAG: bifunctional folylpolyglutamate synthase/dihydrofolate synthase [Candidatus Aminicenantes bacterium]|nr:bifunctional folylpolyglutamate synthase/dihydrofolate synthase [Candidatus Aminicenantes bacterium]